MSPIKLTDGFSANIQIQNANHETFYKKKLNSSEEVTEFITKYGKSKEGWDLLRGLVIPLRTDNLKDFSADLFLPTFINFALKINNVVLKIFVSLLAIGFDIISVPLRLLTAPLRVYYNHIHPEEEHPMMALIKGKNESVVYIRYEVENVQITDTPNEEGNTFQYAKRSAKNGTIQVALKRLPGGIKALTSEETYKGTYQRMNGGKWILEAGGSSSSSHSSFAC